MSVLYKLADSTSRMKVLIDADIPLELFLNRSGLVENAETLLIKIAQSEQIEMYISDLCFNKFHFYLSKEDIKLTEDMVYKVKEIFSGHIIPVTPTIIKQARKSPLADFDSAIEVVSAISKGCGAIVTNNCSNFIGSNFSILSVDDLIIRQSFLRLLEEQKNTDTRMRNIYQPYSIETGSKSVTNDIGGLLSSNETVINSTTGFKLDNEFKNFCHKLNVFFCQTELMREEGIHLDEIELSININNEGKIILCGSPNEDNLKGAIKLKFKRR